MIIIHYKSSLNQTIDPLYMRLKFHTASDLSEKQVSLMI